MPLGLVKRGESALAPVRPVSAMCFETLSVSSGSSGITRTPASVLLSVIDTKFLNGLKSRIFMFANSSQRTPVASVEEDGHTVVAGWAANETR